MSYEARSSSSRLVDARALPLGRLAPGASTARYVGELVAFNTLVLLANGPIVVLLGIWDDLQYGNGPAQPPERHRRARAGAGRTTARALRAGADARGAGRARRTSASATRPISPPILEGITLNVEPGTMVAIVGRSGSGKTTLVRCLAGLLEPTEGTIHYDGVDMRTLDYRDLRRQIGYVLQDSYLFDDTIARNIAFGDEEPDMDAGRLGGEGCERARVRRAAAARLRDADRRDRACCSPAASGSGSRSRARSTTGRRCSSSTRRRARSTPSRSARCRRTWTRSSRGGRRS